MTSWTISLMPETMTFFLGPDLSALHGHFNCVDMAPRSVLPFVVYVSSASCPKDVSWTSSAYAIAAYIVYAIVAASIAFFCYTVFYVVSRNALTSATAFSFCLFSSN